MYEVKRKDEGMLDTAPKLSACAPMYGNNWYGRLTPWSIEIYP